ncbi:MAG: hypothetical protein N6V41_01225 [Candidatus Portiera aleyrodidarum]|nr:hypothetical protein [Candidatus Portiera aleyrodidarum]
MFVIFWVKVVVVVVVVVVVDQYLMIIGINLSFAIKPKWTGGPDEILIIWQWKIVRI